MASISTCAIHPAIGIARVGNSPTDWFYGPESPGEIPGTEEGFTFKDDCGRIKRQAARFRIYATYDDGTVRELNHDDPGIEIEWTVHVANTKAAWYESLNAMDLPELGMTAQRRNKKVLGADRLGLEINPGPRSICGA